MMCVEKAFPVYLSEIRNIADRGADKNATSTSFEKLHDVTYFVAGCITPLGFS